MERQTAVGSLELVSPPLPVDPHGDGTSEIVKYEWVSMERKESFSGPTLYMSWITHVVCGFK